MYQVILEKADSSLEVSYFDFYDTAIDYAGDALDCWGYASAEVYEMD